MTLKSEVLKLLITSWIHIQFIYMLHDTYVWYDLPKLHHVPLQLLRMFFRQQDELRRLKEELTTKDVRIRQLELELNNLKNVSPNNVWPRSLLDSHSCFLCLRTWPPTSFWAPPPHPLCSFDISHYIITSFLLPLDICSAHDLFDILAGAISWSIVIMRKGKCRWIFHLDTK